MKEKLLPGISQCMIVKNEEKNIERALSWGKGIVAEQIVVDTGSTDRTIKIAQSMGAKVYEFAWADDFAAAKNYAVTKAKCEWIAFLDADEYFLPEDAKNLAMYIRKLPRSAYDGICTAFVDLDDNGNAMDVRSHLRIFQNLPGLRYHRRIHEVLRKDGTGNLRTADMTGQLTIYHTGYGKAENLKKQKSRRNLDMILAELAEHPDDYEMYGYLGNVYEGQGELELAEEAYRKSVSLMPEERKGIYDVTTSEIWRRLLNVLTLIPEKTEAEILEAYQQARVSWPEDGDYDYVLAQYYGSHGNYQEGEQYLRQSLELLEQYGYGDKSVKLAGNILKAQEMLAMCCFNNGNLAECVKITARMLKEDPYLMSPLVVMLSALLKDPGIGGRGLAGASEAASFLENNFYQLKTLKDRLFLLRAAMAAGYQDLVQVMKKQLAPEEFAAVDKAMDRKLSRPAPRSVPVQLVPVPVVSQGRKKRDRQRIALFYCSTESFNFFADQLDREFRARGHETFILDLRNPPPENPHSYAGFLRFASAGIDAAVCYDAMCIRDQILIDIWNRQQTMVVDIFMDPPLRFHLSLENTPARYHLFCCDWEHVEYVKQYFPKQVPKVDFMPHVGVVPEKNAKIIPYSDRKYDILFCGTYYRPEDQMEEIVKVYPENSGMWHLYQKSFENLKKDSSLSVVQGILFTINQWNLNLSEEALKSALNISNYVDWAIRMYQRGRVVTALAKSGLDLYLLGRGWENHLSSKLPNVHRIDDRIPYRDTLTYMADAKINLNVMPGFKQGTHDRVFNTLLRHSIPLTDSSAWIDNNYIDGVDIALYNLDQLERLPDISRQLLSDSKLAERIIKNGYEKTVNNFTWNHCANWILEAINERKSDT